MSIKADTRKYILGRCEEEKNMTVEEWDKTEFMLNEVYKDIKKYNPKDRAFAKALLLIMGKVRFQF